jgi:hypothetical protein
MAERKAASDPISSTIDVACPATTSLQGAILNVLQNSSESMTILGMLVGMDADCEVKIDNHRGNYMLLML